MDATEVKSNEEGQDAFSIDWLECDDCFERKKDVVLEISDSIVECRLCDDCYHERVMRG